MNRSMSQQRRSYGRFLWMFCCGVIGAALGAALMWWGVYVYHDRAQATTIQRLNKQLGQVTLELNEVYAQRDVLENKLAVESSTRQGLERTLSLAQKELGATRDQIAFFYELLPPGPEGSVSIRGLDIQQQGELLHFRVVLMRHGPSDDPFDGMLQFEAAGQREGEAVTVVLEPARLRNHNGMQDTAVTETTAGESSGSTFALKFDEFQRSTGLLQIPDGVELESVTLNVLEGETLRVSRTVDLPVQRLLH